MAVVAVSTLGEADDVHSPTPVVAAVPTLSKADDILCLDPLRESNVETVVKGLQHQFESIYAQ